MADTLKAGDFVLVNKLPAGIRTCSGLDEDCKITNKWGRIQPNDIIVFNGPVDYHEGGAYWSTHNVTASATTNQKFIPVNKRPVYIKRCVGMPGDTLRIEKTTVIRNNVPLRVPKEQKIFLRAHLKPQLTIDSLKKYEDLFWHIRMKGMQGRESKLKITTQYQHITAVKKLSFFNYVDFLQVSDSMRKYQPLLLNSWEFDSIPSMYIPKSGDIFEIDSINYSLYKRPLLLHEQGNEEKVKGTLKAVNQYLFQQNYYFVKGDNHYSSIDSRHWGLLPENHILGEAEMILFSLDHRKRSWKKWRWDRFLKWIN